MKGNGIVPGMEETKFMILILSPEDMVHLRPCWRREDGVGASHCQEKSNFLAGRPPNSNFGTNYHSILLV